MLMVNWNEMNKEISKAENDEIYFFPTFKSNNSVLPHDISCNFLLVVEKDVYDDFSSKSETPIFVDITGEFNFG